MGGGGRCWFLVFWLLLFVCLKMELTFFNCASNLLHSSFFCSMAISKDLSLESLFSPADANEDACSLRSIKLDWKMTKSKKLIPSHQNTNLLPT